MKKRIDIGTKVLFKPLPREADFGNYEVIGTIVQIYPLHHWFRIEWGKHKLSTCRHFSDIGDSVTVL